MPKMEVVFHQESPNKSSLIEWIEEHNKKYPQVVEKIIVVIRDLEQFGTDLSPSKMKRLQNADGMRELLVTDQSGAYRILCFIHNEQFVLCRGVRKHNDYDKKQFHEEVKKAIKKKQQHLINPAYHTYDGDL